MEIRPTAVPLSVRVQPIECGVFFAFHPLPRNVVGVFGRWARPRSFWHAIERRTWARPLCSREKGTSLEHCPAGCMTEEGCKMGFNLRRSRGQMAMDEILRGGGGGGDVDGNGAAANFEERRSR